jgi:hypothetical protein
MVFDDLEFRVNGGTVTLLGQVNRAALKSDAEKAVKQIAGVQRANNQIDILPISQADQKLRLAEYRSSAVPGVTRPRRSLTFAWLPDRQATDVGITPQTAARRATATAAVALRWRLELPR